MKILKNIFTGLLHYFSMHKGHRHPLVMVFLALSLSARAEVDTVCKANLKKLDAALTPYIQINSSVMRDMLRHTAWVNAEMAYALENGCNVRDADVASDLRAYKGSVQEAVKTCESTHEHGTDCSPKQHFSAAGYRRPVYTRAGANGSSVAEGGASSVPNGSGSNSPSGDMRSGVRHGDGNGGSSANERGPQPPEPQEALARTQQKQTKADERAKRDGRRKNQTEYQASNCVSIDTAHSLFGLFKNNCSYSIDYTYCVYRPKPSSWASAFDCEKQKFGSWSIKAGGEDAAHLKGGESVHWLACRSPAWALDGRFEGGRISGRCRNVGES